MGANVTIQSQSVIYAAIYAPTSLFKLRGDTEIHGMAIAGSLDMGGQAEIHMDTALEAFAESLIPAPSTPPSPPPSWTPVTSGELDIKGGSTLSNNAIAVRMVTPQAFTATSSDFLSNGWGLRLNGSFDLTNCTASDNTTGGVWLTDLTDADVQVLNLTLADNAQYGVYAESDFQFHEHRRLDDLGKPDRHRRRRQRSYLRHRYD